MLESDHLKQKKKKKKMIHLKTAIHFFTLLNQVICFS